MSASSSGDQGQENRYLTPEFWAEKPENHFWETGLYTEKAKEYYRKNIVEQARKEMARKYGLDKLTKSLR